MITLASLQTTVAGLDRDELAQWIAAAWVRPAAEQAGEAVFEEIDVARIRLIHTLRHELRIEPGSLPVVLSLLDQLHDVRRQLHALHRALHR